MTSISKNVAAMFFGLAVVASTGTYAMFENVQVAQSIQSQTESGKTFGHVEVVLRDGDGNIKAYIQSDNSILDVGKDALADDVFGTTLSGAADTNFDYIEIDTSSTAATEQQTGVQGASTCARVQDSNGAAGDTGTNGQVTITVVSSFSGSSSGCTDAMNEAALCNAASSGTCIARSVLSSGFTMGTSDSATVTYEITFT